MAEERRHRLEMVDRQRLDLTGVSQVTSFDDSVISLATVMGELVVKGENLNILHLDVEKGNLSIAGRIFSLAYLEESSRGLAGRRKALWQRLLK